MKTLGERLKDLRKEKVYTLEQVAEYLNSSYLYFLVNFFFLAISLNDK